MNTSQIMSHNLRNVYGLERTPEEIKEEILEQVALGRKQLATKGYLLPPYSYNALYVLKALHEGDPEVFYHRDKYGNLRMSLYEDETDWEEEIGQL